MAGAVEDDALGEARQHLAQCLEANVHARHANDAVAGPCNEERRLADDRVVERRHQLPIAMQVAIPVEAAAKAARGKVFDILLEFVRAEPGEWHGRRDAAVEKALAREHEGTRMLTRRRA